MNINKQAATDASRWLTAEMGYGKGAGTRRKLLEAEISEKMFSYGEKYSAAFEKAYNALDQNKFAQAAIKERKRLDHVSYIGKNVRAIVRGDVRNVSPSLILIAGVAYYAHVTGYDKVVFDKAKVEFRVAQYKAKEWWKMHQKNNATIAEVIDLDKPYGGQ